MKNSFSDANPFTKLIFSLFIILVSFLITFIIGLIVAIPLFHIGFSELSTILSDYNNPNNIRFLKYLQTLQAIGLFIIPAFIIGYLFSNSATSYLCFKREISANALILTIFIFLISIPIISYLGVLNSNMQLPEWLSGVEVWMKEKEESAKLITTAFLRMDSVGSLLFNLFMIGALPAIGEELIFRGVFQKIIGDWAKNMHVGILVSAFIFSAMHFQFYGFFPRFILGVLLGYLFYWSGSIWIPILGHFVNNSVAIISYFFYADEALEGLESIGQETVAFVGISMAIVSASLFAFYKESRRLVKS
jgi:hypothetical protein